MNAWVYSLGMHALATLAGPMSLFNEKLRQGVTGRKNTFSSLIAWKKSISPSSQIIWFHCASLGEFEQGRPVIEEIKRRLPECKIALTFFSPSGYEIRKNYTGADWVGYMPWDTPKGAKKFIELLNPSAVAFVKYEFWANYFFELKNRGIPLISFSTIFQPNQRFFSSRNRFWKDVLQSVEYFFVQDQTSADLLNSVQIKNYQIAGDTRFDRVLEIAHQSTPLPWLLDFKKNKPLVVIGSSYAEEEIWALRWLEEEDDIQLCIVPHDVDYVRIAATLKRFESHQIIRFSQLEKTPVNRVIVVDKIGMLSSIYSQADFVILGGGFHKGIHNSLEAAVYDTPIFFGPKFEKFKEAKDLIAIGAASSGITYEEMRNFFSSFTPKPNSSGGKKYVQSNTGATQLICDHLLGLVQKK